MIKTSVYPAWLESPYGVNTAEDVAVAWRNMISKSRLINFMRHTDLPKPLPMDP